MKGIINTPNSGEFLERERVVRRGNFIMAIDGEDFIYII